MEPIISVKSSAVDSVRLSKDGEMEMDGEMSVMDPVSVIPGRPMSLNQFAQFARGGEEDQQGNDDDDYTSSEESSDGDD